MGCLFPSGPVSPYRMKIDYIANLRLPTYKAHGVQITKMCEKFAGAGAEVQLIVPSKRHTIDGSEDPFEYYQLERNFTFTRVNCLDLLGVTYSFSSILYWIDLFSFLAALAFGSSVRAGSVIYTRDPLLLIPFSPHKHLLCVEVHDIPPRTGLFFTLLKRAQKIIVLTSLLKADLIAAGIPSEKIMVNGDAVELEKFEHPQTKEEARERLGLSSTEKIAMYIGRLDGWKGVDTLYHAAEFLGAATCCVIIGGDVEEIDSLKKKYPRVTFLGPRPYTELADNQAAADVLILPNTAKNIISARFTSPLKLFTYMTSERPIVASDLPSIREVVDETCAYLVTPDDEHALAMGIEKLLGDHSLGDRLARAAKERVQKYTWDARVTSIISFLEAS